MDARVVKMFTILEQTHADVYNILQGLKTECASTVFSKEEYTDMVYGLNEASKRADDIRKELDRLSELCIKLACILWVKDNNEEPIRTLHCTGSPQVKQMASVPRKSRDPEGYAKFMKHLGIPEHLYTGEHDTVRPHWPGMVDYLTSLAEQGKPLPPGIDPNKTYPEYRLIIRAKKGVKETA